MLQSNYAHVPQLLSLWSRAHESKLLSPCAATIEACAHTARVLQQRSQRSGKPEYRNQKRAPVHHNWRQPVCSKTQGGQKLIC